MNKNLEMLNKNYVAWFRQGMDCAFVAGDSVGARQAAVGHVIGHRSSLGKD